MDRFGAGWEGHQDRIREVWEAAAEPGDVLLIVGDLSWAMNLTEAADDMSWIADLPGRKVVIRGNHDYWWSGITKARAALGETVHARQADFMVLDGVAIVGTRGWQAPGSADPMVQKESSGEGSFTHTEHDQKINDREVSRIALAF